MYRYGVFRLFLQYERNVASRMCLSKKLTTTKQSMKHVLYDGNIQKEIHAKNKSVSKLLNFPLPGD